MHDNGLRDKQVMAIYESPCTGRVEHAIAVESPREVLRGMLERGRGREGEGEEEREGREMEW